MTQGTLHPTARGRDVVREQVGFVALSLRPVALVVAVVVGIFTIAIAIDIVRGDASTWFDSDEWSPIGLLAFLLPFAVWRAENRFGPALLWTLPVDRRRLAVAKVFAGWVWLMIALAIVILWQFALALLSGVANAQIVPFTAFVGATGTYLLGSALVLGLRHPLRWLLGTAAVFYVVGFLHEALERSYGMDTFLSSGAVGSVVKDVVPFISFLLLGAGLIALWAAVWRHRESRRR
jgi:hypothetical protein